MKKAYSYTRFSTPEQAKGDSYRRQVHKAKAYAEEHGLELDEQLSYHDAGVSAFQGANAETGRLGDFLAAVQSGKVPAGSVLLIENLDRLTRNSICEAQTLFMSILNMGITIVTTGDNNKMYSKEILNNNPYLIFEAIVGFLRANDESARKSERVGDAWANKRANARTEPLTSKVPGWLKLNKETNIIEVVEDRAKIVRRIFSEYISGKGQERIAIGLNRDNIECWGVGKQKAQQWHKSYVSKTLFNPAVIGQYTPHVGRKRERRPLEPIPHYYPAVISTTDYHRVQELRAAGGLKGTKTARIQNVFSRLARCPLCHSVMTRINKGDRWQYLICTRAKTGGECLYHTIPYQKAEDKLLTAIPTMQVPIDEDRRDQVLSEISDLNTAIDHDKLWLDRYKQVIINGTLSPEDENPMFKDASTKQLAQTPITILEEMRFLEKTIEDKNVAIDRLNRKFALTEPELINSKLASLKRMVAEIEPTMEAINANLRELCSKIVFDYENGSIVLHYKHAELTSIIPFPESRLKQPLNYAKETPYLAISGEIELDYGTGEA